MTARSDSGSSCSPIAVEPATSANSTVTTFRASRRFGRSSSAPHDAQKRASSALMRPQRSHARTGVAYETSLPTVWGSSAPPRRATCRADLRCFCSVFPDSTRRSLEEGPRSNSHSVSPSHGGATQWGGEPGCADRSYDRLSRLDDVLEDGRRAQHAAGADCTPRQLGVVADERVEAGQVLIEAEHV